MPESSTVGRADDRAPALGPLQANAPIGRWPVPGHQHAALWRRQRAMLGSIGRKLMQGKADVLHRPRIEEDRRPLDLRTVTYRKQLELSTNEVAEPSTLPVLLQHEILGFGQALNALAEMVDELVHVPTLTRGLQSHAFDDGELVLGAMREFAHQELRMLLPPLELE